MNIASLLIQAHSALRAVDASDTTQPQINRTLDEISAAIAEIERFAVAHRIQLGACGPDIARIEAARRTAAASFSQAERHRP